MKIKLQKSLLPNLIRDQSGSNWELRRVYITATYSNYLAGAITKDFNERLVKRKIHEIKGAFALKQVRVYFLKPLAKVMVTAGETLTYDTAAKRWHKVPRTYLPPMTFAGEYCRGDLISGDHESRIVLAFSDTITAQPLTSQPIAAQPITSSCPDSSEPQQT